LRACTPLRPAVAAGRLRKRSHKANGNNPQRRHCGSCYRAGTRTRRARPLWLSTRWCTPHPLYSTQRLCSAHASTFTSSASYVLPQCTPPSVCCAHTSTFTRFAAEHGPQHARPFASLGVHCNCGARGWGGVASALGCRRYAGTACWRPRFQGSRNQPNAPVRVHPPPPPHPQVERACGAAKCDHLGDGLRLDRLMLAPADADGARANVATHCRGPNIQDTGGNPRHARLALGSKY